jgi:hypothetical protein
MAAGPDVWTRRPVGPAPTHWTAVSHSSSVRPRASMSTCCHAATCAGVGTRRRMNRAQLLQNAQSPS